MIMKTRKKIITNETQDYTTNTNTHTRKNNQTKGKLNPRKEKKKWNSIQREKLFFYHENKRILFKKKEYDKFCIHVYMCD